ncbi:hypothetical protein G6M16_007415 [Agrobacterium tumefaciens]|nr:hypothetical protein G6M16_007415 [Agrobacterium tumefaciens]
MIQLPNVTDLPASRSGGPESWGEAWSKAAGATDETMRLIENTNADYYGLEKAYDERIKLIADITGQALPNPMREAAAVDLDPDRAAVMAMSLGGGGTAFSSVDDESRTSREDEFNTKALSLSGKYRQEIEQVLSTSVEEVHNQVMRDAEKASQDALNSPELGAAGRLGAQLVGGLRGAARDPTQWGMAMFGAGGATSSTVAGRIGKTVLTEALLNGGQELVLQGLSQERKRAAGLEHGMGDMLQNAGVAAVFGSLFGGSIQGGAELARVYRMGKGGEDIAARVLDGNPQPGDIEAMAKAMNVDLTPEKLDLINRSFEERVLDDYMVSSDAAPAQIEVMQAAERYAADPDNFPPPEIVERMLAEQEAGRLLTMRPDDYERIYSGDANAIDDIADTFFASDVSDAASRIDEVVSGRASDPQSAAFKNWFSQSRVVDDAGKPIVVFRGEERLNDEVGLWFTSDRETASAYSERLAGGFGEGANVTPAYISMRNPLEVDAAGGRYDRLKFDGVDVNTEDLLRIAQERGHDGLAIRNVVDGSSRAIDVYRPVSSGQIKSIFDRDFSSASGFGPRVADLLEGQRIRPDVVSEPLDDVSLRNAEIRAGELAEPARDRNGNPENYFDFMAIEDGDGKVSVVSAREALEMAAEPEFLADLLEACKL